MGLTSYAAHMTMAHACPDFIWLLQHTRYLASQIEPTPSLMRIDARQPLHSIWLIRDKRRKVLSIFLMLLLLVGFFGLFAALVFFSEGVIEPESKS